MSINPYPKYKDSGVEWLGMVPEHWEVKPLKHLAGIDSCGCYGTDLEEGGEILRVATTAQIDSSGRFDVERMPERGFSAAEVSRYGCSAGDILVVKSSGSATNIISGKAGLVDEATPKFIFSNFLMRVRTQAGAADPQFIYALLRSNLTRQRVELMCSTTTYPNLQIGEYVSAPLPVPPIAEQSAIASFLDHETSKIDALIFEQEKLIELLKEKRSAVISHAVTKGLNPDVKMKDSGVEWLGMVPEHWEVLKLKFLCKVQTGDKDTENAVEGGQYPFFVRSQTVERINSMAFDCEAVLTAGDGAGVGKVFHYHKGPFDFHQRVYMMSDFQKLSGPFFFHYLRENFFKVALEGGAKSTVDSLRRPMFMNFPVCVPSVSEQSDIVRLIEVESSKFATLTAEAQRAIDLLQERRSALISAAVTGQIDVRDFNPSKAA
jgi:type I restriction enzyme S subunit